MPTMANSDKAALPLAVTMGEPSGVGAELTLKSWATARDVTGPFFTIDDPDHLAALAERLGLAIPIIAIDSPEEAVNMFQDALPVLSERLSLPATLGKPTAENSSAVIRSIDRAVEAARNGQACAVVTNPIQKSVLYAAGFEHPGHTEYLAALCGGGTPIMMLACDALRAVPVTVHLSLRDAINKLTMADIIKTCMITADALTRDFGITRPRLAVAGLNPHSGEDGTLGAEDQTIIRPAVAHLKAAGVDAWGPVPPDALFNPRARETYDAAICMYHDQALIPVKALDFDGGVNITLGLPIIRTSPDHGTALDIAGTGQANPGSLIAAMIIARKIAANRARSS